MNSLDESIGRVIEAMDKNDMLSNSIILFMSDNGGPPRTGGASSFENGASNWPLRGVKFYNTFIKFYLIIKLVIYRQNIRLAKAAYAGSPQFGARSLKNAKF